MNSMALPQYDNKPLWTYVHYLHKFIQPPSKFLMENNY